MIVQMKEMFSKRIYNDCDVNFFNFIYCIADETMGEELAKFCYERVNDLKMCNINELIIQENNTILLLLLLDMVILG
ncbi:hypothetical protein [Konateibacter massiliensis]|uniref:hypothetical protein n=1 Tax=Konateibacter massiliensis TaxID=2002841 RepID=UPI000C148720|nr:hypothetical protein [Konateibacter massiliensis]